MQGRFMGKYHHRFVNVSRVGCFALMLLALLLVGACATNPQEPSEELAQEQDGTALEQSLDQELMAIEGASEPELRINEEEVMADEAASSQDVQDAIDELDTGLDEAPDAVAQEPVEAEVAPQPEVMADEAALSQDVQDTIDEELDATVDEELDLEPEVDELADDLDMAQGLDAEEEVVEIAVTPVALESDGPQYPVTKLVLQYGQAHPQLPPIEQLGDVRVDLLLTETGYVAPRDGVPSVSVSLSSIDDQLSDMDQFWFYASAIRKIGEAVVGELNRRGLIGVYIAPHLEDIEEGEDLRPEEDTALRMVIRIVIVSQMRTLGSGDRVPSEERINHSAHQPIKDRSPVQPAIEGGDDQQNLLRRDLLDDYVFRLNRHPGRRVDVAVSRAQDQGGIVLDYLVTENRPLLTYFQVSNTGTKQTDQWRERFGLVHNQFTGNDDILSLDYITSGFDESHSFVGSYEAPLFDSEHVKWRAFGSWSEFTASDVGATEEQFLGESWSAGGELIANIAQDRDLFLDLIFGGRYEHIFVDNQGALQMGEDDFLLVYLGLNLERIVEISSTLVSVSVERNLPGIANTEQDEILNFGRDQVQDRWTLLKWNVNQAFYLEPVFDRAAWSDPSTPDTSTLAHEFVISFKGQHAFGTRVIPQMEQVAGGLYSVRGYEESVVAGDSVFIGSLEYRFHVPRVFKIQPNPSKTPLFGKPFRFAPQQVYARPDWDLIFRTFFDAARVIKSDRLSTETHDTLLGAGIGLELQLQRNVNLRIDWGIALEEAGGIDDGNDEVHFVATFLF